jgi:uncharacterized protein (TIGR00725 family)
VKASDTRPPERPRRHSRQAGTSPQGYTVTLYGSGDPPVHVLDFAGRLGQRIGERGWLLKNGGYGGTMAASAQGARAVGGKVIAVTCSAFGRPAGNPYASVTIETPSLFERLARLIEDTDAFGAFAGGTGTLTEVFLTWELMAKGLLPPRPLCLLGPGWDRWWDVVQADPALAPRLPLLSRAREVEEALVRLAPVQL